jgi:Tol biopolymer transport system component
VKRVWLAALLTAFGVAVPAQATFPGKNGRIAYTWSRGADSFESGPSPRLVGVVSIRPDGNGRRLVARGGRKPAYSPDGRSIAFMRARRLWVADADGDAARPVTPNGWRVGDHRWSPGGTRLAFDRGFESSVRTALYTIKPDGTGLQRLLRARQPISLSSGAWSPDGKGIVYNQSSALGSLVRILRAGHIRTLARPAEDGTWSSRGVIGYESFVRAEGRSQVCLTRAWLDTPIRCIGFVDASVTNPQWSPDGSRLLVSYSPRGGGPAEIWTLRPDGTVLVRAPKADYLSPIISPNGGSLAFNLIRFAGPERFHFTDLFVQRADGTGRRLLVRGGQAQNADWQPLRR